MASINQNFEIWQGDAKYIEIDVADIENLGVMTCEWGLARGPGMEPLIFKTTENDGGITVTDNVMRIELLEADTRGLQAPYQYYHEARVVDALDRGVVVATGTAHLRPASLGVS